MLYVKRDMNYDTNKIEKALFSAFEEMEMDQDKIQDAIFHMTDWLSDLDSFRKFYESPESLSPEELSDLVMGFLVHVPAHVAAASKLVTGLPVSDVFGIGATIENKE